MSNVFSCDTLSKTVMLLLGNVRKLVRDSSGDPKSVAIW